MMTMIVAPVVVKKTKKRRRGDRVEAKVKGWTKYYGGEITRVNDDGTYDIKFDDGERKRGVKDSEIKGNRVEAKVKGWTKYYGGEITRVNDDGTYDKVRKMALKIVRSSRIRDMMMMIVAQVVVVEKQRNVVVVIVWKQK